MKAARMGLIYSIIFLCFMIPDYQKVMETAALTKLLGDYNRALDQAVEDALTGLVEKDDGRLVWLNKEEVVKRFFVSLALNMNKMENYGDRELLYHYVPVVMLVERERFYLGWNLKEPKWEEHSFSKNYGEIQVDYTLGDYVIITQLENGEHIEGDYHDIVKNHDISLWENDTAFQEERKKVIVGILTECFNNKLVLHNEVAQEYGMQYEFTLPVIDLEEWYRTIDDVGFVAFFQGYPYGNGSTGYYNRVALGGARVHKKE